MWRKARATATVAFEIENHLIQHTVAVFATERLASRDLRVVRSLGGLRCFYRELHGGIEEAAGAPVGPVRSIRIESPAAGVSATRAQADTYNLAGTTVYIDQIRAKAGRTVSVVVVAAADEPVSESFYEAIVAHMKRRLSRAGT